MSNQKKKQSIIAGALTGTAGVFLTKAIGLFYVIPFNRIAGSNTVFYSYAYTIYDYALQICLSGMPFAIAALIAKYNAKNDNHSIYMVRKVARTVMLVFGLIACSALILFSKQFAYMVIPEGVSADYITKTQNVLVIVSFALIVVPLLSYYRGIYQGLKELKVYALTQVLEQIVRVAFLLGASCICVYLLNMERVWAAYMGVASTTISALFAIGYFLFFDKKYMRQNIPNTNEVIDTSVTKVGIFKELMSYAIPYLLSAVIANSSGLVILLFFSTGLTKAGVDPYLITEYQGIINYQAHKICSIPQVIATGFTLALIPHITENLTKNDFESVKKLIEKSLATVSYLALPLIGFMVAFSKEIYFVMYGNATLTSGGWLLGKSLLIQFFWIIVMVLSSMMVALKMRKQFIILSFVQMIFVVTTVVFWLSKFGVNGYYICKTIEYLIFIGGAFYFITKYFKPDFGKVINKFLLCCVGCLPMLIIVAILWRVNFDITTDSRIITLLYGGFMGLLCIGFYGIITAKFNIPQELFNIEISRDSISNLVGKVLRRK